MKKIRLILIISLGMFQSYVHAQPISIPIIERQDIKLQQEKSADPITLIATTLVPALVGGVKDVWTQIKSKPKLDRNQVKNVKSKLKENAQKSIIKINEWKSNVNTSVSSITELKTFLNETKNSLEYLAGIQSMMSADMVKLVNQIQSTEQKRIIVKQFRDYWGPIEQLWYKRIIKFNQEIVDNSLKSPANISSNISPTRKLAVALSKLNSMYSDIDNPIGADSVKVNAYFATISGAGVLAQNAISEAQTILDNVVAAMIIAPSNIASVNVGIESYVQSLQDIVKE